MRTWPAVLSSVGQLRANTSDERPRRHYSLEVMSKCSINSRARSIFHRQHARGRGVRQPATGGGYDDNLIYAHGCRVVPGIFPGKSIDFEMRKNGHSRELCAQRVENTSYDDAQAHTQHTRNEFDAQIRANTSTRRDVRQTDTHMYVCTCY